MGERRYNPDTGCYDAVEPAWSKAQVVRDADGTLWENADKIVNLRIKLTAAEERAEKAEKKLHDVLSWVEAENADGRNVAYLRERDAESPRPRDLPIHRTEAGYPRCSTCDGGGCYDCTDPAGL